MSGIKKKKLNVVSCSFAFSLLFFNLKSQPTEDVNILLFEHSPLMVLCGTSARPFLNIHNGNCTEWSAIWSEIIRVISKSNERAARVRFEITSTKFNYHFITSNLKSQNLVSINILLIE